MIVPDGGSHSVNHGKNPPLHNKTFPPVQNLLTSLDLEFIAKVFPFNYLEYDSIVFKLWNTVIICPFS